MRECFILEKPAVKGYSAIVRLLLYTNQLEDKEIRRVLEIVKTSDKRDRGVILCMEYWLEWPRLRLLWIGQMDNGSMLSMLPREIIRYIFKNCQ